MTCLKEYIFLYVSIYFFLCPRLKQIKDWQTLLLTKDTAVTTTTVKSNPEQKVCLIYSLVIHKSMALNPSNIIVSGNGTTSETIFDISFINVPMDQSKDK